MVCCRGTENDTHSVSKCWSNTENDVENSFIDISANQSNASSTISNEVSHSMALIKTTSVKSNNGLMMLILLLEKLGQRVATER